MKILLASILPIDDINSWSGICLNIFNHLKKNHDVDFCFSEKAHKLQKKIARASFYKSKITRKKSNIYFNHDVAKLYAIDLDEKINEFNPDFVLCLGSGTEFAYSRTAAECYLLADANFKLLHTHYSGYQQLSKNAIKESYEIEQQSFNSFDKIFYTSNWALNSTKKQYPYLAEKLFPINFGSNIEDDYFPDTNYLPESIEEVKLLAIGTNYKRKGIDQAEVLQKTLGCQLDIIGIKKKLDKSNSDEVSEMVELYKNAHFLLLFSEADCTPIVVNEASSFGLPVLAYDAGGISEIVNDSVNGFVVDSIEEAATKIKSLLENKEEYTKLSASARAFYEKELNWDKFEQRLLQ